MSLKFQIENKTICLKRGRVSKKKFTLTVVPDLKLLAK
jgi:hypothetical protein